MVHFLFDLFFNAVRRNAMEDEEEARALVLKRANKHAGIPALNVVRSHFGPRFDELLDQMVSADPMRLGRRGLSPADTQMREEYAHYCRTVIVRVAHETTFMGIAQILEEEGDLWFVHGHKVDFRSSDHGLAAWTTRWRARWDYV